jgi:hypothetical protein
VNLPSDRAVEFFYHLCLYKDDPLRVIKCEAHQPPLPPDATIACQLPRTPRLLTFPSNNETPDVPDERPANQFTFNGAGN